MTTDEFVAVSSNRDSSDGTVPSQQPNNFSQNYLNIFDCQLNCNLIEY